ncbi:MAG: choice-of-anchor tandem repeat GloVer-containing protein [Steroidobacteraceae bacterium]|jgi:uncharacterized repeat protein (TIGR03803 family)
MNATSKWLVPLALAAVLVPVVITTQSAQAQTFTTLRSFDGSNGSGPYAGLVQATDGNLYGTTENGGLPYDVGTVFRISPEGTFKTVYNFGAADTTGYYPNAGLILGSDGNLYGTTHSGGINFGGTVFKLTLKGKLTTLYEFCSHNTAGSGSAGCTDGYQPNAGLVEGTNGDFYGTTSEGGATASEDETGGGTVFKVTSKGVLTTLYSFCSKTECTDGALPNAGLVQATDGNFYGTTDSGGTPVMDTDYGTVFKITPEGTLTTLHSFSYTDGGQPDGALIQAGDGNLYGTTSEGGPNLYGTVFKITLPGGTLTTLNSFDNTDGATPWAGLVEGSDGSLYGTTLEGGTSTNGDGTIFKITTSGTLTSLYSFCSKTDCRDGDLPYAGLVQATNGSFYGTTDLGGTSGDGTVFSLSVGLGPFVETLPTLGKVGAAIKILGTDLTGASGVDFNGTAAVFDVVSASEITATLPAGATSGNVSVTTPSGTLTSNKAFLVTPQITGFTPPSGPVGTSVTITGVSLMQTSKVTFGGASAITFAANSDTQVTATVPKKAKTGKIAITTPGGTATSATEFTVTE